MLGKNLLFLGMKESNFYITATFQVKPHNLGILIVEKHPSPAFSEIGAMSILWRE